MAALTVQNLRDYTRGVIDVDPDDIADFLIDAWIQEGYDDLMGGEVRTPWFEIGGQEDSYAVTTIAGQQTYALPTITVQMFPCTVDPKKVISARGPEWELKFGDQARLESLFPPAFMVNGEPVAWSYWGETGITLWPTPLSVQTINVRAYRDAVDFVSMGAGGVVDAPIKYHTALQQYVLALGWAQQSDLQQYSVSMNSYLAAKDRLSKEFRRAPLAAGLTLNGGGGVTSTDNLPPRLHFPFESLSAPWDSGY